MSLRGLTLMGAGIRQASSKLFAVLQDRFAIRFGQFRSSPAGQHDEAGWVCGHIRDFVQPIGKQPC